MNDGKDTEYYLFLGYKVIAVEANNELADKCKKIFESQIKKGNLTIVNKGISDSTGIKDFYVNEFESQWSSFKKEVGSRNNTPFKKIQVECITLADLIKEYGTPYYCKIDIEQNDILCIDSLLKSPVNFIPEFISVEADNTILIDKLFALGYRKFKMVCQGYIHEQSTEEYKFTDGCSGRFGDDAPGTWVDMETVKKMFNGQKREYCWYDFHAKLN